LVSVQESDKKELSVTAGKMSELNLSALLLLRNKKNVVFTLTH